MSGSILINARHADHFTSIFIEVLNDNCGHFTFTVPNIAPGNYLLRAEVIGKSSMRGEAGCCI